LFVVCLSLLRNHYFVEALLRSARGCDLLWVGENVTARTPIFCVVLKDGEYWEVEAEWPDGTIEPIYKFKAGLEALNWVKTESAAWVAERVAMASQ
jgi:hypothetical protein